ncbi:YgdB family protein [Serratia microhaemolytica]|uniref:YgdB family protein n=1 Tax=Serratia microhaemolytica TaxID=2675110 RepID=UPI000FDCDEF4|nr:YgdB family protein [Serratia microhaemolytica]
MNRAQQNGSILAAVMLLLLLGLMVLNGLQRQLESALLLSVEQQRYLRAHNQAASALSWGLAQRWPTNELSVSDWFCLPEHQDALQACLRYSTSAAQPAILRGRGIIDGQTPLWLYQLVTTHPEDNRVMLRAQPNGWLDFCPAKDGVDCAK